MGQFDKLATLYDRIAELPWRTELEIPSVLHVLGELHGKSVLDIGCGSGVYSRLLRERGAERVVGIDESAGMIDHARDRERAQNLGIEYRVGPVGPGDQGSFDVVLAVYVLPYAETRDELVQLCTQAYQALRPGGRFVTLPVHPEFADHPDYYAQYGFRLWSDEPLADASALTLQLKFADYDLTVTARYWTKATLDAALREAGFSSVEWRDYIGPIGGVDRRGAEFWHNYLSAPHAGIIECRT